MFLCTKKISLRNKQLIIWWNTTAVVYNSPPEVFWFSLKNVFLTIFQISEENTWLESVFNKVVQNSKKETPTQVFPCEICEIFKNVYFKEHLRSIKNNSRKFPKNMHKSSIFVRLKLHKMQLHKHSNKLLSWIFFKELSEAATRGAV